MTTFPGATSRANLSICLAAIGQFAAGLGPAEEAIRIAEAVDDAYSIASVYTALGRLYLERGDYDRAVPLLERSVHVCRVTPVPIQLRPSAAHLGYAYAMLGRVEEGLSLLEEARMQRASSYGQSLGEAWLGEVHLRCGLETEAEEAGGRALALSRQHQERDQAAWALRLLGEVAAHANPPDAEQAEGRYREALALAEELEMRPLVAHCHLGLGMLYQKVGRDAEAQAELATAAKMYRAMEMTSWLAKAEAVLA
ncbi:MAG TPA: tetratricopeptide repeat protein [Chloroflexota bacterium]|jgi:tetratricopeptide (TPR) repeat protein